MVVLVHTYTLSVGGGMVVVARLPARHERNELGSRLSPLIWQRFAARPDVNFKSQKSKIGEISKIVLYHPASSVFIRLTWKIYGTLIARPSIDW